MLPKTIGYTSQDFDPLSSSKETKPSENQVALNNGRYVKIHLIGKGHFAEVFLAESLIDGKKIALKTTAHYADKELYTLQELQHVKNVVKLIDFSSSGKEVCLALELADCSVDKLVGLWGVDDTALNQKQLNFFLAEILRAYINIKKAYLLGSVDLNSRNILYFSKEGRLKLTDFGISHGGEHILGNIGCVMHYVLFRMAHRCKATKPNEMTITFCDDACEKGIRFGQPTQEDTSWQKNASKEFIELVTKLYKRKFSFEELRELLGFLESDSDSLPVPRTLQIGEELSITR